MDENNKNTTDKAPQGTDDNVVKMADTKEKGEPIADDKVQTLAKALDQSQKDNLYLRAEFDNFRKNSIKERSELIKYGPERFILKLVEVLDNFDRALETKPTTETLDSYVKGFELTSSQLYKLLEESGVKKVSPLNEDFDPKVHQALSSEVSDKVKPGKILRVFKPAYMFYEKVMRPAQVVVSAAGDTSSKKV